MNKIPEKMKALVAYSSDKYQLEEVPVPQIGDDDLLIKTEGCGICASDVKCREGAARYWGGQGEDGWVEPPFIPGHEFLGTVVKKGRNVTRFEIGDRVAPEQIAPCGECRFCESGQYWMCEPHRMFGYFKDYNGGMAEYVRLPLKHARVHKVPKELPFESAVLIEPFACAYHCIEDRAAIGLRDTVVLSGSGTLGLGMVNIIRRKSPRRFIVLDMVDERLELAKKFGGDSVITWNPGKMDVVKAIRELTDGYGCDIYIEATGNPASVRQGMKMIRKHGRFVEFSVFGSDTTLDWSVIGDGKELDVIGSHLSPYSYPYVLEGMKDGSICTDGVVTSVFSLENWEEAYAAAEKKGQMKIAFRF